MKIGIFGGSFNPAHEGHVFVSDTALKQLGLDAVWWLVSPQNPIKPRVGMAPQSERLAGAKRLIKDCRIVASTIEADLGMRYTADTVRTLKRLYPKIRFVWLMGADNLEQIPHWRHWHSIFHGTAIAVLERSPYSYKALAGKAALFYRTKRRNGRAMRGLLGEKPPVWAYIRQKRHASSSTALREMQQFCKAAL